MNLTRDEARERSAILDVASYDVGIDLTTGDQTFRSETTVSFTCSAGLAAFTPNDEPDYLLKRADDALYDAKAHGKNRVSARRRSLLHSFLDPRRRRQTPAGA